ncbi:hypothetical protein C8F04DRAFT_619652 [Mycena alexandri]|uniref:Uncharacterized protein n=1 Tax=Mycena alexandri TaxID=1745969 RepID=A0AAD6ST39_9AGAR|nr:hypothetical protein C8F04DRAFT_619652 [Mycena alexandri]
MRSRSRVSFSTTLQGLSLPLCCRANPLIYPTSYINRFSDSTPTAFATKSQGLLEVHLMVIPYGTKTHWKIPMRHRREANNYRSPTLQKPIESSGVSRAYVRFILYPLTTGLRKFRGLRFLYVQYLWDGKTFIIKQTQMSQTLELPPGRLIH